MHTFFRPYLFLLSLIAIGAFPTAAFCGAITLSEKPIAVGKMPHSILLSNDKGNAIYVGDRTRYSLCTGAAWFPKDKDHDQYLVTVNLFESTIQTFRFETNSKILEPLDYLTKSNGIKLEKPENATFSHDGKFLAIPSNHEWSQRGVNIYEIDYKKGKINPKPISFVPGYAKECRVHGARFSPDDNYLAYVTTDTVGRICFYRIKKDNKNRFTYKLCQSIKNPCFPLLPKAIDFSPDSEYVAICYCLKATSNHPVDPRGLLEIYKFNKENGTINPSAISSRGELLSAPEDIRFYPDASCILAANQGNDTITINDFNAASGKLGPTYVGVGPKGRLSFPHGISITDDGKYLASSSYGDDKVTVYSITKN